jgi:hypothetical protein
MGGLPITVGLFYRFRDEVPPQPVGGLFLFGEVGRVVLLKRFDDLIFAVARLGKRHSRR